MLSSNAYNYVDVLDRAADASWLRETLISNNIANVDTPGYKRQDVDFQSLLAQELGRYKYTSLDQKVRNLDMSQLAPNVYTDNSNYSYRLDENNVDIDIEQVELASEQIKYQALTSSISSQFQRMRYVL